MFKRTLYYQNINNKLPQMIRKINKDVWFDMGSKKICNFTGKDLKRYNYIKLIPYASAAIVRFLNADLGNSLQLVITLETTDKMVNDVQYGFKINLLRGFMSDIPYDLVDVFEYVPKSTDTNTIVLIQGYESIEVISAIHLYLDDYVEQVFQLIKNYGISNIKREFDRFVAIKKPVLLNDNIDKKKYKSIMIENLESVFNTQLKIYKLSDNYINALANLSKENSLYKFIINKVQGEALCELYKQLHPASSYPIEIFETPIIPESVLVIPYTYNIPIKKLKDLNPNHNVVIVRDIDYKTSFVIMFREKPAIIIDNPDITGFSEEEMNQIRSIAI